MQKIVFITAFIDKDMYSRCVTKNRYIKNRPGISCVGFDNSVDNQYISKRYNQFLDSWNYDEDAWFVFCHSDWELDQDLTQELSKLDREVIYGPIGTIVSTNSDEIVNTYNGYCREMSRDDTESRLLLCMNQRTGTLVDTLDAQCMIVHSSLINKFNLRFDELFSFDLYCEDFSANAKIKYGIPTKILRLECCHHNIARNMDGREAYYDMLDIFNKKYPKNTFGSTVTVPGRVPDPVRHIFPTILDLKNQN